MAYVFMDAVREVWVLSLALDLRALLEVMLYLSSSRARPALMNSKGETILAAWVASLTFFQARVSASSCLFSSSWRWVWFLAGSGKESVS